ncbi:MAG: hypothetical protein EPN31_06055 [Castellaniella sp.]|uniref:hypothetical protein n=1 Tax=Castellaniella sp. TaxID=1955812 RepID=UPI0012196171|nr:hypothetical protein [Castellaniella sp.]TAN29638.1 MAG: hypothetical protein EPN31_06055 [Castellaniella sp.]
MPPFYDPPYDSPIEDEFAQRYVKYAADNVEMRTQVDAPTLCGRFVVDFVLSTPSGHRVGIECDGKEFHDEHRDEWRDAMIIGDGVLDDIYRVRGSDIVHNMDDVLYLLANFEPDLFDPRAQVNLRVLTRTEVLDLGKERERDRWRITYLSEKGSVEGSLLLEARRRVIPPNQRRFWSVAYHHAVSLGGGRLDDVMKDHQSRK